MKNLFILLFIFFFVSCSRRYSPEIETVLNQAGNNRSELEKVLEHYAQNPADSLKLKAAEFLIVNMPDKYSVYYDAPWNDVATVNLRWTSSSDKQMVLDTYKLGNLIVKEDVKYITAKYLINNIDLAFKVWREQPWGKHISFDTFCEEILPYRVNNEPLENWREKVLASFADINRSFQEQSNITAVTACAEVNRLLPTFRIDKDFSQMNYSMLMATTRGTCIEMTALAVFVMRALGIPVTIDSMPKWYYLNVGHSWNVVCDSTGKHIPFMGTESGPDMPHYDSSGLTTKINRRMFAKQNQSEMTGIPMELENLNKKEVSSEYSGYSKISIPIWDFSIHSGNDIYLASLGHEQWNIISREHIVNQQIQTHIHQDVLYMPVFYKNHAQIPAYYPLLLNEGGDMTFFEPDTIHSQMVTISEMSPSNKWWFERMVLGVFEGANCGDFSDASRLHIVNEVPENYFQSVKTNNPKKFRYVRYVSPNDKPAHCNVAEIKFYDSKGSQLHGIAIGTAGTWCMSPTMTYDKATDGNVCTFFDADTNDSWTGLDLGEAKQISEIHYLPRNVDWYGIYEDHIYKLFFWNGREWQSLGTQKASSHLLKFQVPSNALLYLKNVTIDVRGNKLFIVQNGIQKWI